MVSPNSSHDAGHVSAVERSEEGASPQSQNAVLAGNGNVLSAAEQTLRSRARDLARVSVTGTRGEQIDVLVFRLGDEQYALELRLLQAVHRTEGLTPVPCTPSYISGILNVRGAIVTVIDLAAALGLAATSDPGDEGRVLLAELPLGRVGLLVGEVLGHRSLALDDLQRPLSSRDFVWGIADVRIAVLRLEELFADGRFEVREDVG